MYGHFSETLGFAAKFMNKGKKAVSAEGLYLSCFKEFSKSAKLYLPRFVLCLCSPHRCCFNAIFGRSLIKVPLVINKSTAAPISNCNINSSTSIGHQKFQSKINLGLCCFTIEKNRNKANVVFSTSRHMKVV